MGQYRIEDSRAFKAMKHLGAVKAIEGRGEAIRIAMELYGMPPRRAIDTVSSIGWHEDSHWLQ